MKTQASGSEPVPKPQMAVDKSYAFGFPGEWDRFSKKHQAFLTEFPRLNRTIQAVFGREAVTTTPQDRLVFFIGSLCIEEFKEILLLCANAYGFAAAKLLRSLYERTLTCAYLANEPTAYQDFLNYHHVQRYKEINHLRTIKGVQVRYSADEMNAIEAKFRRVERHFQETLCQECNKVRLRPSWTKLSLPAMAKKVGPAYERFYFSCYFQPTMLAHSTVIAFMARLKERRGVRAPGTDFTGRPQRVLAARVLGLAHSLVLLALSCQNSYFKLGIDRVLSEHTSRWKSMWKRTVFPSLKTKIRI